MFWDQTAFSVCLIVADVVGVVIVSRSKDDLPKALQNSLPLEKH